MITDLHVVAIVSVLLTVLTVCIIIIHLFTKPSEYRNRILKCLELHFCSNLGCSGQTKDCCSPAKEMTGKLLHTPTLVTDVLMNEHLTALFLQDFSSSVCKLFNARHTCE